jgi:PAS domain S-box-containing protein
MPPPVGWDFEATVSTSSTFKRWLAHFIEKTPAQQAGAVSSPRCYAIAVMMVVLAFGARELIGPADIGLRFVAFSPAVALTAVLCGFWPGMLAALMALALTNFYIVPHGASSFDLSKDALLSNLAFLTNQLIVCGSIQAMHNHFRRFRAANRHLVENHNLLNAIIEGTTDAVFLKDTAGRYLHANGAHLRMFGKPLEEVIGKDGFDIFPPQQARAIAEEDRRLIAAGEVATYEQELTFFASGEKRTFLTTKGPTFDERGRITGIFGISRDITDRRKEAEEFRLMIRTSLDGFWITDLSGRFLEVNDAYCELVGYTREQMLSMGIADVEAVESPEDTARHIQQLIEVGSVRFETRHRAKDGHLLEIEVSANYAAQYGGRLYCFLRNITERKHAERALRDSTELLRLHMENSPMAVVAWDNEYRVTQWAGEAKRMFGWSAAETLGTPLMNLNMVYEEDIPLVQQTMAKLGGGPSRYVISHNRNVTKDGRVIDCVWYNSVLADENGRMTAIMSQVLDVTEQKLADKSLKDSEAKFHGLFQGLGEGVQLCELIFDAAGKPIDFLILDVNPAYERHTGLMREQVVGRFVKEVLPDMEDSWLERFATVAASNTPVHFEKYSGPLGRWFDVHANPMGGNRFAAVFSDITERRKYERKLKAAKAEAERANNAKSRFLAAASHDLRQPLSALKLYVGVLKNKLNPEDQELLMNMQECVSGLSDLLSNLLDLSKLEAGVVTPQVRDFDLDEMFGKLLAAHSPEAEAKALSLRCGFFGLSVRTDRVLFQRIVGNLVSNAIRYTEQGGVLVACRRRGGKHWVEVWDTGIGIPRDKIGEIFEEFKQLGDPARTRGSGLGLTIVAKTAQLLGLEIRVRSRPGRGSMFAIELPLGLGVGERSAKLAAYQDPLGRMRIAVVDDNPVVLNALVYAMENGGHEVIGAATGETLLAGLDNLPPDVMVCDYRLAGGETGYDVITAVRKAFASDLPAVIITGDTDPALLRSLAEKRIAIQHKPVEFDVLLTRIKEVMKRPAVSAEMHTAEQAAI